MIRLCSPSVSFFSTTIGAKTHQFSVISRNPILRVPLPESNSANSLKLNKHYCRITALLWHPGCFPHREGL
jgi:hypothetical protein